jgi:hypothetical protein
MVESIHLQTVELVGLQVLRPTPLRSLRTQMRDRFDTKMELSSFLLETDQRLVESISTALMELPGQLELTVFLATTS